MAASRLPVERRHFVEVSSRNLGGGHVCCGRTTASTLLAGAAAVCWTQ